MAAKSWHLAVSCLVSWRATVSWLLLLATLSPEGTAAQEDIIWPEDTTNFELWNVLDDLEPAISGSALRVSDLGVRMVDMGDKAFTNPVQYSKLHGYSACKCRLACMASWKCLAFQSKNNGRCIRYTRRGNEIGDAAPLDNMQFKMLNAAIGDLCKIDLECSRQTRNSFCVPDVTTSDNATTCQCPGDFVPHEGACVDPMSLTTTTTTVSTTTTTVTTTAAATTTTDVTTTTEATTTVATTAAAPTVAVTEGSVTLEDMSREAEWPCDEANSPSDSGYDACKFLGDFATTEGQPTPMWLLTVDGTCDLDRGRCKFPAVLSTVTEAQDSGAPRIEAWRSAGQFQFDMSADFPAPPPDLGDPYTPGPADAEEAWKHDCTTTDDSSTVLTGFLGLARDDQFNANVPQDMDLLLCTRFTETFLQVDPATAEVLEINENGDFRCPSNHVITGVWDSDSKFLTPKKAKCSRLTAGSVDDSACEVTGRHAASGTAIYWNACGQGSGPAVVTGLTLSDVTDSAESRQWDLRCCRASGPATATSVN